MGVLLTKIGTDVLVAPLRTQTIHTLVVVTTRSHERGPHLHERKAREEETGAADGVRHKVGDALKERLVFNSEVVELRAKVVEVHDPHSDIREPPDEVRNHSVKVVVGVRRSVGAQEFLLVWLERRGWWAGALVVVIVPLRGVGVLERLFVDVVDGPLWALDVVAVAVRPPLLLDGHDLVRARRVAHPPAVAVGVARRRSRPRLLQKPEQHGGGHEQPAQRDL